MEDFSMKVRGFSVSVICILLVLVCGSLLKAKGKTAAVAEGNKDAKQVVLNAAVDFNVAIGKMRALHGVVNGPLDWGGITDVSIFHKEAGFPYTHLNAPHWYSPDVVDIHCIYPNFDADVNDPNSYFF